MASETAVSKSEYKSGNARLVYQLCDERYRQSGFARCARRSETGSPTILYAMHDMGLTPDKAFRKSANVVGEVMANYHPHGDASIYDTMVRLAQDFNMRYMLVEGQGNFGSVDGDPAAAMRYTESRMSKIALELLRDIDKETVDFVPNYDGRKEEPVVLPSRFPNLLVNGSSGIAVGMATNIPPHNLGEVIDGVIAMIDNPDITIAELMKIIKGPDFPTAGEILGYSGIRRAYETGRGSIIMRAKTLIEEDKGKPAHYCDGNSVSGQ